MAVSIRLPGMNFDTPDFDESMYVTVRDKHRAVEEAANALIKLDRAQLLATPFSDLMVGTTGFPATEKLAEHISSIFADDFKRHVDAWESAWASADRDDPAKIRSLVEALKAEHGIIILGTWSKLTSAGISNLDKVKWIHKHLCDVVVGICFKAA